ncbi:MAG: hypothetical protein E7612_09400 [Ruminococcaceae bacterium]|nr:hypothetical protein [Oscillospiraceae bacterium]
MKFEQPKSVYFAAANGYDGFRNYFNKVFIPQDFERIYVLKGGPGTGKSSLMKKICTTFQNKNYKCEAIFCSSDPSSLDGIILQNNNKKIGILDGTAPHETDAKIPGAIDEIINLGDYWNDKTLKSKKKSILKLNENKSYRYSQAYNYLRIAGCFADNIRRTVESAYKISEAKIINDILFDIKQKNEGRNEQIKLNSSFSKNGYTRLNTKENYPKEISVSGVFGSEYIFTDNLLNEVKKLCCEYTRFPSPFSDRLTEAIYLPESDTLITVGGDYENTVDTSAFLDCGIINYNKEHLSYYAKQREDALSHAKHEFLLASNAHFELEEIYTPCMNFEGISKLTNSLIIEIEEILR